MRQILRSMLGSVVLLPLGCLFLSAPAAAQPPGVERYVSNDIQIAVVVRPQQILKAETLRRIVRELKLAELLEQGLEAARQVTSVDPREVSDVALLLDAAFIRQQAGLPPDGLTEEQKNQLKQISLAFHNFHEAYQTFPGHDGHDDNPDKGNLSWRVHLLPFLGHEDLYEQFWLDEPWDSEHNSKLIEQMPDVLRTPGVDEAGRTSLHLFTGAGAPFEDGRSPRFRDFTDGTSNTILAVVAEPDTAEVWTKPGGLDVELDEASSVLGLDKKAVQVAFADGSVRPLPVGLDPEILSNLISPNDSKVVPRNLDRRSGRRRLPAMVLRGELGSAHEKLATLFLGRGSDLEQLVDRERTSYQNDLGQVTFASDGTMIAGPVDTVRGLIAVSDHSKLGLAVKDHPKADLVIAIDPSLLTSDLQNVAAMVAPGIHALRPVERVVASVYLRNDGEHPFAEITLEAGEEQEAQMLSLLMQGIVQAGQAQVMSMLALKQLPIDEQTVQPVIDMLETISVEHEGTTASIRLPHPPDDDAFWSSLGPTFEGVREAVAEARQAAAESQRRDAFKHILLAFHNYHDVNSRFVNYNGDSDGDDDESGLSWRVHLLPYLNKAGLYQQFHLDEPWDSEHNRTLIEKIPNVFRTPNVDSLGHTSVHVFRGDETPFSGDDEGPQIREFTDGTSNTLLIVEAGPETAEPWTKPGGIKFTGDDIVESLGKVGDFFLMGFADGSVRRVETDIDELILKDLIRHQDGNFIGNF